MAEKITTGKIREVARIRSDAALWALASYPLMDILAEAATPDMAPLIAFAAGTVALAPAERLVSATGEAIIEEKKRIEAMIAVNFILGLVVVIV